MATNLKQVVSQVDAHLQAVNIKQFDRAEHPLVLRSRYHLQRPILTSRLRANGQLVVAADGAAENPRKVGVLIKSVLVSGRCTGIPVFAETHRVDHRRPGAPGITGGVPRPILPATAGFIKSYIEYQAPQKNSQSKKLSESIEKGVRLMVSTTRAPMRLVTFLSLFGAAVNLLYSLYVVLVGLFVENVAPGWVSMSLQMSGMFFLISLVLLVLGEYILHMASLTNEGPQYHVGQEFTSTKMTRLAKLNIEEVTHAVKSGIDK